jgi:hypothetical protein
MKIALRVNALIALLIVGGCQAHQAPAKDAKPQAAVTHVVLCWLKMPGDEAGRRRIIETTQTLKSIPGVVSVTAGRAMPSTRPVVDSSFDVGIVITFTDESALRAYDQHPTHKRAVETVLRPLVAKLLVYDIETK